MRQTQSASLVDQYKRKTILATGDLRFPHVKKRLLVTSRREVRSPWSPSIQSNA